MEEFVLRSTRAGDSLAFRADAWNNEVSDYEGPVVTIELVADGFRALTSLPEHIADTERLEPLLREIDRDWRGWEGQKRAGDPDRDRLAFAASHDGLGHVLLTVFLDEGFTAPSVWSGRVELVFDVGSASAIADSLGHWQESTWPVARRWRSAAP